MSAECPPANPSSTLDAQKPAKSADLFIFLQCGSKFRTNCTRLFVTRCGWAISFTAFGARPTHQRGPCSMMKTLTTLTAAATVAAALLAAPTDANAQWRRGWGGPAVGLGILGGVAAGAIVGSAIANSYGPAYVVQPGYVPYGAYGGPGPGGRPG